MPVNIAYEYVCDRSKPAVVQHLIRRRPGFAGSMDPRGHRPRPTNCFNRVRTPGYLSPK